MVNQPLSAAKTIEEYEEQLLAKIEELSYTLNGLENHGPFLRIVENWKSTSQLINDSWHLVSDPIKLHEMRVTKMAALELINTVELLRQDLEKAKTELAKIHHPDDIINKEYDEN